MQDSRRSVSKHDLVHERLDESLDSAIRKCYHRDKACRHIDDPQRFLFAGSCCSSPLEIHRLIEFVVRHEGERGKDRELDFDELFLTHIRDSQ
jgi:hypothetical protein